MVEDDSGESEATFDMLCRARDGDPAALEGVFGRHRAAIRRAVARRLDPHLRGRLDPSDVVQEAHIEVLERLPEFLVRRPMPFRIWLLRTAMQRLLKLRHHARAARSDVARETTMSVVEESRHDSGTILFPACAPSPSQQAAIGERAARLGQALWKLSPPDQAILELRTYQGLSYAEVADRLRIDPAAARKRFGRALLRLRVILIAEGLTESCL